MNENSEGSEGNLLEGNLLKKNPLEGNLIKLREMILNGELLSYFKNNSYANGFKSKINNSKNPNVIYDRFKMIMITLKRLDEIYKKSTDITEEEKKEILEQIYEIIYILIIYIKGNFSDAEYFLKRHFMRKVILFNKEFDDKLEMFSSKCSWGVLYKSTKLKEKFDLYNGESCYNPDNPDNYIKIQEIYDRLLKKYCLDKDEIEGYTDSNGRKLYNTLDYEDAKKSTKNLNLNKIKKQRNFQPYYGFTEKFSGIKSTNNGKYMLLKNIEKTQIKP